MIYSYTQIAFCYLRIFFVYKKNPPYHTNGTLNKEETILKRVFNVFSIIALVFTIIGALNWLLIGIFGFNLVNYISFGMAWLERLLYVLVGLNGIYMLVWLCVSRGKMVEDDTYYRDRKYSEHNSTRKVYGN